MEKSRRDFFHRRVCVGVCTLRAVEENSSKIRLRGVMSYHRCDTIYDSSKRYLHTLPLLRADVWVEAEDDEAIGKRLGD